MECLDSVLGKGALLCCACTQEDVVRLLVSALDVGSGIVSDAGQRELARELVNKCREHDKLAVEARFRANEAAFDGSNRNLLNRWKVRVLHSSCSFPQGLV